MTADTAKITTRLRPDVDRRLRAAAALRRVRLSRVINEALDQSLPTLPEISAMVTGTPGCASERSGDPGHRTAAAAEPNGGARKEAEREQA